MSTIRIPPVLRAQAGGASEVRADGSTVGEALRALTALHPDTEEQLFGAEGDLNRYVNVYLNDEDVRVLDGLETPVSEDDTIVILPAMAGGSAVVIAGAVLAPAGACKAAKPPQVVRLPARC